MMKQMRENTKIILWIVVVAFIVTIFAVWGLDLDTQSFNSPINQGLVGKVNGVPVTPQSYQAVYSQIAQQYRSVGALTATQQELLRDQAWNSIVSNILTEQEIKKLGITVSDQEVLSFIRNSPPAEVQQYFVDEAGNFDYAAYQAALNNPNADWTGVEAIARQRIPVLKLNQYLVAQVHVGANEIRQRWEEENIKMVAQYVTFPNSNEDVSSYQPTPEEITAYYEANAKDFKDPEKAVVEYARVPIAPTATDRYDIYETMKIIQENVAANNDFEGEARIYSEGFSASTGGDIGFVSRGQREEALIDAAEALQPGQVSPIITTDAGVYLIKLNETKEQDGIRQYRLSEIFLKLSAGSQTIDSLVTVAQELQRRAVEAGLETAAAEAGLTVEKSEPFADGFPIPGLGFAPTVSRFAFANDQGALSNVLSDDNNYYVCRVVERVPEGLRALDGVREEIAQRVLEARRNSMAKRKAEGFHLKLRSSGIEFEDAATAYGKSAATTDTFTVQSAVSETIPAASAFQYAALALPVDQARQTPPVESDGAWYVIRVTYRSEYDPESLRQQAAGIRDRLYASKTQEYVSWWYGDLVKRSKIEDFRGTL